MAWLALTGQEDVKAVPHAAALSLFDVTRDLWQMPPQLTPSAWVEQNRVLSGAQTFSPGPWRHELTPYLRGLMDLLGLPDVEEVWFEKAAQVGGSEGIRCWMAWAMARAPGPMILVLPDENKGREVFAERILPMFREPGLVHLVSNKRGDEQLSVIRLLNGGILRLGWARSPSSLATHPARYAIGDEIDKWAQFSGRESSPVNLLIARTKTYPQTRKIVMTSTPTTADGEIHRGRERCAVQLRYHVPCPACGQFQQLVLDQLKWPAAAAGEDQFRHGERVRVSGAAEYECRHCAARWPDRPETRNPILQAGVWAVAEVAAELPEILRREDPGMGGVVRTGWPSGRSVGLVLSEINCPLVPWSDTAGAFIKAVGDLAAMMEFRNQRAAEPFEAQITHKTAGVFAAKAQRPGPEEGVLPRWTRKVLATADVQADRVYYVLRAWGPYFLSRKIRHGMLPAPKGDPQAFALLYAETLGSQFEIEGGGGKLGVELLGIDTRYRGDEVKMFSLRDTLRIRPLLGVASEIPGLVRAKPTTFNLPGRKANYKTFQYEVDVDQCRDWLGAQIEATVRIDDGRGELVEHEAWQLCGPDDGDYDRQLASTQKVLVRRGAGQPQERWQRIADGAPDHYFDCETYQRAVAQMARVEMLAVQRAGRRSWSERLKRK